MIIFRKGLYLILTNPARGYERMTEIAVAEGGPVIQLRYKQEDIREFVRLSHSMREITRDTNTNLIINDRVDIACICGADGVHLGQKDIPPKEARALMGKDRIIGLSTHNIDQVGKAQSEPVDYIGFGPVYKPFLKDDHDPVTGIELLRAAVEISQLPVVAIGGMNRQRLDEFADIRFHNVACIGAIESSEDPAAEMRAIEARIIRSA